MALQECFNNTEPMFMKGRQKPDFSAEEHLTFHIKQNLAFSLALWVTQTDTDSSERPNNQASALLTIMPQRPINRNNINTSSWRTYMEGPIVNNTI